MLIVTSVLGIRPTLDLVIECVQERALYCLMTTVFFDILVIVYQYSGFLCDLTNFIYEHKNTILRRSS